MRTALLAFALACTPTDEPAAPTPVDHSCDEGCVAPQFIGTGGVGFGVGNAFVGATMPHGFAKLGPHTTGPYGTAEFLHEAGYWYGDDTVRGFAHTHLHGTGAGDYGLIMVMPAVDLDPAAPATPTSPFNKASEVAEPGYYAVTLDADGIRGAEPELGVTIGHQRHRRERGALQGGQGVVHDLVRRLGVREQLPAARDQPEAAGEHRCHSPCRPCDAPNSHVRKLPCPRFAPQQGRCSSGRSRSAITAPGSPSPTPGRSRARQRRTRPSHPRGRRASAARWSSCRRCRRSTR